MSKGFLVTIGGWLALISFFVPWIKSESGHASGLQMAKSDGLLFVLLAVAVLYIVVGFLTGTRMVSARIPAAAAIALAVASFVILYFKLAAGVGQAPLKDVVKSFQIGLWGTILAHLAALAGGLLDLFRKRA